jgi:ATP-dependent DNA ligase
MAQPIFPSCRNELKGRSKQIVLVAFDLLYLNGYDLRRLPLFERKAQPRKIIVETDVQFSGSFEAGKVDHGFEPAAATDLQARLKPLIRKAQPYTKGIAHRGIWVEPSLLAEIEYRAKSAKGKLRHPVFKGLRDDI